MVYEAKSPVTRTHDTADAGRISQRSSPIAMADDRSDAVAMRKLSAAMNTSPRVTAQRKLSNTLNSNARVTAQRKLSDLLSALAQRQDSGASPVQMVKIKAQVPKGSAYKDFETSGKPTKLLESWLPGVHPDDRGNLDLAIMMANSASENNPGLRYRGPPIVTPEPVPFNEPKPAPKTQFETIHGHSAHGATSYGSTALGFLGGFLNPLAAFDVNALKNAGTDTVNSANRTTNELRRGEYGNAAISTGQTILSGVQTVLSTPVSHVASHFASHAMGSPVPLPVGDAVWYPANYGKAKLDDLRTPKEKTD